MVPTPLPTRAGDVLILQTTTSFTHFTVGVVMTSGQTDFHRQADLTHLGDKPAAVLAARAMVKAGGRVFLVNIDTRVWMSI